MHEILLSKGFVWMKHPNDYLKLCFSKKTFVILLSFVILFSSFSFVSSKSHPKNPCVTVLSYQVDNTDYWVDGLLKGPMDVAPEIKSSRMFLVIRYVTSEIEGVLMMWDSVTRRVTIVLPTEVKLMLWIGNPKVKVEYPDGRTEEKWIDDGDHNLAPYVKGAGFTMLPMRFVAEYLGADEILWDGESRTVDLEFTDYRCLNRKEKVFGRIEEVSDLGDGTSMVILTCQDGSVKRFVSVNNLSGDNSTNIINDYLGYAELEYIDEWVFSWRPISYHEPFGVLEKIEFERLETVIDAKLDRESNLGTVNLTLREFDGVLYFNLVVDGNWIIKNSALSFYPGKKTQKYFIELDSSEILYSASLTSSPISEEPDVVIRANPAKGRISMMRGLRGAQALIGIITGGSDELTATQGCDLVLDAAKLEGLNKSDCRDMESTPSSVLDSVMFLNSNFTMNTDEDLLSIESMKDATSWNSEFGSDYRLWWTSIKNFFKDNDSQIQVLRFEDFDSATDVLDAGFPVLMSVWDSDELGIIQRGHTVPVTGIYRCKNGYELDFLDDIEQDDHTTGTNDVLKASFDNQNRSFYGGGPFINGIRNFYFVCFVPENNSNGYSRTTAPLLPSYSNTVSSDNLIFCTDNFDVSTGIEEDSLKLNSISVFESGADKPTYKSGFIPASTFKIPDGVLENGKSYFYQIDSKTLNGLNCGVSHRVDFDISNIELKWVDGFFGNVKSDRSVDFIEFESENTTTKYSLNSDVFSAQKVSELKEKSGYVSLYVNSEGEIFDIFELSWVKNKSDFFKAFKVSVLRIFKNSEESYFLGRDDSGEFILCSFDPEKSKGIRESRDYIISAKRRWFKREFELIDYKPIIGKSSESVWMNCEVNSFEDGILYVQLPSGDSSFDFFAEKIDENGTNIETYSGCAEILVSYDTVVSWVSKPEQEVCGFVSDIEFFKLITNFEQKKRYMVEFSSSGYRKPLYLNLSIDGNWILKNMYISPQTVGPLGFTLDCDFIKGNSIKYGYSLTPILLYTKPSAVTDATIKDRYINISPDFCKNVESDDVGSRSSVLESSEILDESKLENFEMFDSGELETVPTSILSVINHVSGRVWPGIDDLKQATNWNSQKGCKFFDGEEYLDLSWWKSLNYYFAKNNINLEIENIDISGINKSISKNNPVILDARISGNHYAAVISSVQVDTDGNYCLEIVYDADQLEIGKIITEKIVVNTETKTIFGGIWFDGSKDFKFYMISKISESREKIEIIEPSNGSIVADPYPIFKWDDLRLDKSQSYSFYLYEKKSGVSIIETLSSEKPVVSKHLIDSDQFQIAYDKEPLSKNTNYIWFVECFDINRVLVSTSPNFTFSVSPTECDTIFGEIISTTRDPNTGLISIDFRQCAGVESFEISSVENIPDDHTYTKILGYSGCAEVCIHKTDKGVYLDSWVAAEGDCCKTDPCRIVRGVITETEEINLEHPIIIHFKPCNGSATEYFCDYEILDTKSSRSILGYSGCAEICVLDSGLAQSWTALPEEDNCCGEVVVCTDVDISWSTEDGLPPVFFVCPGDNLSFDKLLRLKNNCREETIDVFISIKTDKGEMIDSTFLNISPRSVSTYSLNFTAPDELPSQLIFDIIFSGITNRYYVSINKLEDCEPCCEIEVFWGDELKTETGKNPVIAVCEKDKIDLSFIIKNNCDNRISGEYIFQRKSESIDYIVISKEEFSIVGSDDVNYTLSIDSVTREMIKNEMMRVVIHPDCGEEEILEFEIEEKFGCKEIVTIEVTIEETDCEKDIVRAHDPKEMKNWILDFRKRDCEKLEIGSCYRVTGEKISDEKIKVETFEEVDCFIDQLNYSFN